MTPEETWTDELWRRMLKRWGHRSLRYADSALIDLMYERWTEDVRSGIRESSAWCRALNLFSETVGSAKLTEKPSN